MFLKNFEIERESRAKVLPPSIALKLDIIALLGIAIDLKRFS